MSTPNNHESWREKLRRAVKESHDRFAGLSEEQVEALFERELDRFAEQLSPLFAQALSAEALGDAPGEEMFAQVFEEIHGQGEDPREKDSK